MSQPDEREYYRNRLASVQGKLSKLESASYVKVALGAEKLQQIAHHIEHNAIKALDFGYWPPLFLFVHRHDLPELQAFDRDLNLVVSHPKRRSVAEVTSFLKADSREDRRWAAGFFEIFVKSRLLNEMGLAVELDYRLPNGKDVDLRMEMAGKVFHVECTVLTDSDEDRREWQEFMEACKASSSGVCVGQGSWRGKGSISGPYYDQLRIYDKVFDKVAPQLNPDKGQMSDTQANLLLVSFHTPSSTQRADGESTGWALDKLLTLCHDVKPGLTDPQDLLTIPSLPNYLQVKALRLNLDRSSFCQYFNEILRAPRKLGGILLFQGCSLRHSRINYNAYDACKISHAEMADIEKLLGVPSTWCPRL